MDELKLYKRRFNHRLEPIKVMLVQRQYSLSRKRWLSFVEQTKWSILHEPEEYVGPNLPDSETLQIIITEIFDDFLKDKFHRRNK